MPKWATQLAWRLWQRSCRKDMRRFSEALENPAAAQLTQLQAILARAEGSAFAKHYKLNADTSLNEYRQRVPIQNAESLQTWTTRICEGQLNQLSTEQIERLVPTSGTTGQQKLIPMTAGSRAEFATAVNLWLGDSMRQHPEIRNGRCYIATSPALSIDQNQSKVPIGFAPDSEYLGTIEKLVLGQTLAVPDKVAQLRGDAWREQTRNYLFNCPDLRFLSLWHPSYLEALFSDDELRELSKKWKQLTLISTWSDGSCAEPAKRLMHHFPNVTHAPKGLWLTEGAVSVPWREQTPVALLSGFYEFETADGSTLLAHELSPDTSYRPILTNSAGLYRYRLGDIVKVNGRVAKTPSLEWIGRADLVSDLCGEKLSDADVSNAFTATEHTDFGLLLPTEMRDSRHYTCLLEAKQQGHFPEKAFESALQSNPHYKWAREIGQLDVVQFKFLSTDQIEKIHSEHSENPHGKSFRLITQTSKIVALTNAIS